MLRIDVKLPLKYTENDIKNKIVSVFPVEKCDIKSYELLKLSLDLTDKSNICYKAALGVCFDCALEEKFKLRKKVCTPVEELKFEYDRYDTQKISPVVIGSGPCGLFCALLGLQHYETRLERARLPAVFDCLGIFGGCGAAFRSACAHSACPEGFRVLYACLPLFPGP